MVHLHTLYVPKYAIDVLLSLSIQPLVELIGKRVMSHAADPASIGTDWPYKHPCAAEPQYSWFSCVHPDPVCKPKSKLAPGTRSSK